jgi:anti-sigma B factor antagonist
MKFETTTIGDAVVVLLPGETLDASNANEFKREIAPLLQSSGKIVFDMHQLHFIDSSGLGAILSCMRQINGMRGELKLCRMQKTVRVLFELVRMHRIFDILSTPEQAAAAFKSPVVAEV